MTACRAASTYPCPLIMHVTAAARRPAATLPVSQTGDGTWWIGLRSRESDEAALRGSLLSVVTVSPTAAYAPAVSSERESVEQALIDSIRRIESTHPGLPIDVVHRSGHVVAELEQSLDRASLLVLGSYHSEQSWSIRLGPVAEELMRLSRCPVMLVGRRSGSGSQLR